MITTPLSARELRTIRDNTAVFTDRPNGVDIGGKLNALVDEVNELSASGTDVIALGASTVVIAVGAAYDGKPAFGIVQQAAADGTLLRIERASWDGSGNLTLHGTANATAEVAVAWFVDAR